MSEIREVAEGAYFVPSYSEQTVIGYQPGVGAQSVVSVREVEVTSPSTEITHQPPPEPPSPVRPGNN
ncbi:MAG: hypothetical protein AB1449_14760 [Chloroflexota bacterium]